MFSSDLGVSIVAESLRQQVDTRLWLAQQLLVTQHLILSLSSPLLPPNTLDTIQSTFLPRTTVMVHCYSVLAWLCAAPAQPPSHALLAQSSRQLAVLRLGEEGLQHSAREHCLSILEMFLEGPGSKVRAVVGEVGGDAWLTALPPLTNMTAQVIFIERTAEISFVICSFCGLAALPRLSFTFFLCLASMSSFRYNVSPAIILLALFYFEARIHVFVPQKYCRLLSTWCDWHCHARQFLLATALLNMCEQVRQRQYALLNILNSVPRRKPPTCYSPQLQGFPRTHSSQSTCSTWLETTATT